MAASSMSTPSGVPLMMPYARANGSTLAEIPISPERNSKLLLFWRLWEKTVSTMKPIAGLNCEGKVLFAAAICGWISARIIRFSSSTSGVAPGGAGAAAVGGAGRGAGPGAGATGVAGRSPDRRRISSSCWRICSSTRRSCALTASSSLRSC